MSEYKLKPCPFCGSKPIFEDRFNIKCDVCVFTINGLPHLVESQWNTRVELINNPLQKENERLKKNLVDIDEKTKAFNKHLLGESCVSVPKELSDELSEKIHKEAVEFFPHIKENQVGWILETFIEHFTPKAPQVDSSKTEPTK